MAADRSRDPWSTRGWKVFDLLTRFGSWLSRSVHGHLDGSRVRGHLGRRRRHRDGDAEALS